MHEHKRAPICGVPVTSLWLACMRWLWAARGPKRAATECCRAAVTGRLPSSTSRADLLDRRHPGHEAAPHQADRRQRRRHAPGVRCQHRPAHPHHGRQRRVGAGPELHLRCPGQARLPQRRQHLARGELRVRHAQPALPKSILSLSPTPLVATFSYNAIGNLTFKSDVGAYSYPAPGQPRPHGVVCSRPSATRVGTGERSFALASAAGAKQ